MRNQFLQNPQKICLICHVPLKAATGQQFHHLYEYHLQSKRVNKKTVLGVWREGNKGMFWYGLACTLHYFSLFYKFSEVKGLIKTDNNGTNRLFKYLQSLKREQSSLQFCIVCKICNNKELCNAYVRIRICQYQFTVQPFIINNLRKMTNCTS